MDGRSYATIRTLQVSTGILVRAIAMRPQGWNRRGTFPNDMWTRSSAGGYTGIEADRKRLAYADLRVMVGFAFGGSYTRRGERRQ